ncbi:MAG: HAD family hydrolase [Deferribacteraceae bacterium]|jgi:HAD superfamily hydrolase (TIGR01509 family)|nr:HAD family hydrolase [Deferribacteraceae bacterium]
MNKKLIIYDFDGVLVDSRGAVVHYYSAVFRHFNIPQLDWKDPVVLKDVFGMSHRQLLGQYAEGDTLEEMCHYVPPHDMAEMLAVTPLENGVAEAIPQLAKDYHLAICTNRGESVDKYLEHYNIKQYFSYVITSLDVQEPKPAPEGVLKILAHFNLTPTDALYIGDSDVDYLAATAAGVELLAFGASLSGSPFMTDHMEIFNYLK